MSNIAVDRDVLHRLLFDRADHRGVVRVHQTNLASELGVTKFTVSRIMHEFLEQGRIRKVGAAKANVAAYEVADPARWS